MYSVCRLMLLHICVKFRENTTNGIRVMERKREHGRNSYVQCSKGKLTRVMVLVFCASTYNADISTRWKWLCSTFKGQ